MSITKQEFTRGLDLRAQVSLATVNQVVDNAEPYQATSNDGSRGLVLNTNDASGVPNVPNPDDAIFGDTIWKNYVWKRVMDNDTIAMYAWNPNAVSDAVLLKWERIDVGKIPTQTTPDIFTGNTRFAEDNLVRTELATKLRTDNKLVVDSVIETNGTIINVRAYGALGDGTVHYVREWVDDPDLPYSSLADVQVDYPWVTDLDVDTIDFAAIQKALDIAWQGVKATYGINPNHTSSLNKSSTALAPTVFLPPGDYHINRTLVIPPKVCFRGQGYRQAKITHSGGGDSKWTNMVQGTAVVKECPIPAGGMYAVMMIRVAADDRWVHITDSLDFSSQPFLSDSASLHCIFGYGASFGGFTCYSTAPGHATIIYVCAPPYGVFDTHTFGEIYCSGYGKTGSYKRYGIICSLGTGTFNGVTVDNMGKMQNVTIKDSTFEYVDYPIYADAAGNLRVYGSNFSEVAGTIFSFGALVYSGITDNASFASRPDTGPYAQIINANCYFCTIAGNTFTAMTQFFAGSMTGCNIGGNSLVFNLPAAAHSGYLLTQYPQNAAVRTQPTAVGVAMAFDNGSGNEFSNNGITYWTVGSLVVPTSGTKYKFFAAATEPYTTRNLISGNNFQYYNDVVLNADGTSDFTIDTTYGQYYNIRVTDLEAPVRRVDTAATAGVHFAIVKAFGKLYKMYASEFSDPVAQNKIVYLNFEYALPPYGSYVGDAGATLLSSYEGQTFTVELSRTAAGSTTAVAVATEDSLGVPSNRVLQDDGTLGPSKTVTPTAGLAATANVGFSFDVKLVKVGATLAVKV